MKNFFESKIKVGLKIIDQTWFYPIVLLIVGLVAYGIIFTRPGFYWDDCNFVYLFSLHNSALTFQYIHSRPFSVWPYTFLFSFTKMTPSVWEFIGIILRWLGILFIYFTLNAIWPKRVWQNKWVGVLMFVFPGYLSQPVSVTYAQHLVTFLLFACSLLLTVQAIKNKKLFWVWMPISVVLGLTQIFMMEYFVVLEIIRPLIIWFTLRSQQEKKKSALVKTLLYWLPFGIGLVVFMWWRLFYLPAVMTVDPNPINLVRTILSSPLHGLEILIEMVRVDVGHLLVSVWTGSLAFSRFNILDSKIARISWLLGIATAVLFGLYIRRSYRNENAEEGHPFIQSLLLGGVALLAGAIPVWAKGVQIDVGKWSDRFTLGPMLGAVILIVCFLDWLFRARNQKQWLLGILLASSISLQITNTNDFRLDWTNQQSLYWQLSWRIPDLKPGTAIIGSGTFTDKSSFYDARFVINLLFSSKLGINNEYGYFDLWHAPSSGYQPNLPLEGVHFTGNTSQAIGMYFNINNPAECVRILDPVYAGDPKFEKEISDIIPISNLNEISVRDGSRVPDPASGSEYQPFIEAFAQTGQWSKANDLSLVAQNITQGLGPLLCNNWTRFQQITGGQDRDTYLAKAKVEFCSKATP